MEGERGRFYDVIARFNQETAMARGILFIPVTLVNIRDKRPLQYTLDENILDSSGFILLLQDGWGPPERNFENDYHLALRCAADPALPMSIVAIIRKVPPSGKGLDADIPEPAASFSTPEEFDLRVLDQLSKTLTNVTHGLDATA